MTTARPWTSREIAVMRRMAYLGREAVAESLGRSVASVRGEAYRQRISLRVRGRRSGLVLGQPRGQRLEPEARLLLLTGMADQRQFDLRVHAGPTTPLCPCGYRHVEVRSSGLCQSCTSRRLISAQKLVYEDAMARRETDAWRAKIHRARAG